MKKKREQLQLTISLLVSNHIDTIGLCMESIKPILEAIPSELIVVDTVGKENSDGSLAVAEKYANLVVPFEWCDDFAKARNAGRKHAKGEWFLYLDDDEWFEDVTEIIDFFKTGKYKNYAVAYYKQRNYSDLQGKNYADAPVGRFVHLNKDIWFVRPIHERFEPIDGNVHYLDCFVHHYGYCHKNIEDVKKHSERNMRLLEMEIKKNPTDLDSCVYLAREYMALLEYDKAYEIYKYGVYDIPYNSKHSLRFLNWARISYLQCLSLRQKFIELLEEGEKLLETFPFQDLIAGSICVLLSKTAGIMKEWESILKYIYMYFEKYEVLDENDDNDRIQEVSNISIHGMKLKVHEMVNRGVLAALRLNRADDVARILQWFWSKPDLKELVIDAIEEHKKESKEYYAILTKCLAEIDSDHYYILLNRFLASEANGEEEVQQAFDTYVKQREFNTANMAAVLKIVLKKQLKIEELTSRINEAKWENWLKNAYEDLSLLELEALREKMEEAVLHENEIKHKAFLRMLEKYILLYKAKHEKNLCWQDIEIYCEQSIENYHAIYNSILFEECNRLNLPDDVLFVFALDKAVKFRSNNELADCLKLLREALLLSPDMKGMIEYFLESVKKTMEESRNTEFDSLKIKLIQEMVRFIENGQKAEANVILLGLQKLIPNDDELPAFEKRIKQM